jgi:ribokinase
MFFRLRGNATLGRNESRAGTILPRRDFCKLHIIAHYVAVLAGAARGGFTVLPVGKVGDDPAGKEMIRRMRRAGMDTRFVGVEVGSSTLFSVCFVYQDGDGGNITNDDSASSRLTAADVDEALRSVARVGRGIALAAPEAPLEARLRLLQRVRRGWFRAAAVTAGEAKEAMRLGLFALADLVSVNLEEAAALAGSRARVEKEGLVRSAGRRLAGFNRNVRLCVTAGRAGLYGWEKGRMERTPPCPAEVVSTAGAGDAVLSALIVAQAAGLPFILPERSPRRRLADAPLETALDLASLLAALAVSCRDTINFAADAASIRRLGGQIGADVSRLEPVLSGDR